MKLHIADPARCCERHPKHGAQGRVESSPQISCASRRTRPSAPTLARRSATDEPREPARARATSMGSEPRGPGLVLRRALPLSGSPAPAPALGDGRRGGVRRVDGRRRLLRADCGVVGGGLWRVRRGLRAGTSVADTPRARRRWKSPRRAADISSLWLCSFTRPADSPRRRRLLPVRARASASRRSSSSPRSSVGSSGERAVQEHRRDDLGVRPAEADERSP